MSDWELGIGIEESRQERESDGKFRASAWKFSTPQSGSESMCWSQSVSLSLKQEAIGMMTSRMGLQLLFQAIHFLTFADKESYRERVSVDPETGLFYPQCSRRSLQASMLM